MKWDYVGALGVILLAGFVTEVAVEAARWHAAPVVKAEPFCSPYGRCCQLRLHALAGDLPQYASTQERLECYVVHERWQHALAARLFGEPPVDRWVRGGHIKE